MDYPPVTTWAAAGRMRARCASPWGKDADPPLQRCSCVTPATSTHMLFLPLFPPSFAMYPTSINSHSNLPPVFPSKQYPSFLNAFILEISIETCMLSCSRSCKYRPQWPMIAWASFVNTCTACTCCVVDLWMERSQLWGIRPRKSR